MMTSVQRPDASEYATFYAGYVALVPESDIVSVLRTGANDMDGVLASVGEERGGHRYAEGKWTIREVLGHLIDAERIFSYRMLRIARGDATPLPGFEENSYVTAAGSDARTLADLRAEFSVVRNATLLLLASLPDDAWARSGTASEKPVSVRALAWITAGHCRHHLRILSERYLAVS